MLFVKQKVIYMCYLHAYTFHVKISKYIKLFNRLCAKMGYLRRELQVSGGAFKEGV